MRRPTPSLPRVYVSLGDDLSHDLEGGSRGAAALLARNADLRFPKFAGLDLATRWPGYRHVALATAGASAAAVAMRQVPLIEDHAGRIALVTLTVGSVEFGDLAGWEMQAGDVAAHDLRASIEEILEEVRRHAPKAAIILGNLPDPTDETGDESVYGTPWDDALEILDDLNEAIDAAASEYDALVADIHAHFMGHGIAAKDEGHPSHDERDPTVWYAEGMVPNDRGASEIRRLFWDGLEEFEA